MGDTHNQILGRKATHVQLVATGGGAQTLANPYGFIPVSVLSCQVAGTGTTIVYELATSTISTLAFTTGGAGTWELYPLGGNTG